MAVQHVDILVLLALQVKDLQKMKAAENKQRRQDRQVRLHHAPSSAECELGIAFPIGWRLPVACDPVLRAPSA